MVWEVVHKEIKPFIKIDPLSILFKDIMPIMHDWSYDKVPIPYLKIKKTKLYLCVLPENELTMLQVPNVVHYVEPISIVFSNTGIGESVPSELDVIAPPYARI